MEAQARDAQRQPSNIRLGSMRQECLLARSGVGRYIGMGCRRTNAGSSQNRGGQFQVIQRRSRMRVYVIAGASQSGKSSTIRALTGAARHGTRRLRTTTGTEISVYVQLQSLDEEGIDANAFIHRVEQAQPHADHVLVALRIRTAMDSINVFVEHGWHIADVVVLGQEWPHGDGWNELGDHLVEPLVVPGARGLPANEIPHRLRHRWGWL